MPFSCLWADIIPYQNSLPWQLGQNAGDDQADGGSQSACCGNDLYSDCQ